MKRTLPFAFLLLCSTSALAADGAMDARNWVARRLAASQHLQLEVEGVEAAGDNCRVRGTIRQVFAGRGQTGEAASFRLPCGPQSFLPQERLRGARVLEVFLKSGTEGMEAADDGQGARILDAPTTAPQWADDPALVREMTESIARYRIDAETKRRDPNAALALARVADSGLRARLLAHAAGLFTVRKLAEAIAATDEAVAAVAALPEGEARLTDGLVALEALAMGQAAQGALRLADMLEPLADARVEPSARDAATLVIYGARIRSGDARGAFASLARLSDPATRRDRLANMPFAQKDFSPVNPQSLPWMDSLLDGAAALPPGDFRAEALAQLCRTAQRAAMEMTRLPELLDKAASMAELSARRRHAPSAQLLALIREAQGASGGRADAARWHAVAASGFDGGPKARTEALRALATFTPAERLAAARLLDPKASGEMTAERLVGLAAR